jgi:hypothetical protein
MARSLRHLRRRVRVKRPALIVVLIRVRLAVSTSSRIILVPVLISNLATTLTTAILPALGKSLIQIRPDNALVELGAANVLHAVERVLVCVVLDEAEATGRLLKAVKAHDEALDLTAFAKQLVYLLFGGVEGEVADVEGSSVFELVFGLGRGLAVLVVVAVAFASALLYILLASCRG